MDRVKEVAKVLKLYPKLRLGEMRENERGNKVFFPDGKQHVVKIIAEPTTVMLNKNGKQVKGFKFFVQEGEQTFKWLVPLFNDSGEGHYLIDQMNSMDIKVGEEIILEMKKRGPKNYIEMRRVGDVVPEDDTEEEGTIDPSTIGFDGPQQEPEII